MLAASTPAGSASRVIGRVSASWTSGTWGSPPGSVTRYHWAVVAAMYWAIYAAATLDQRTANDRCRSGARSSKWGSATSPAPEAGEAVSVRARSQRAFAAGFTASPTDRRQR
jgi:hypothetical protein